MKQRKQLAENIWQFDTESLKVRGKLADYIHKRVAFVLGQKYLTCLQHRDLFNH